MAVSRSREFQADASGAPALPGPAGPGRARCARSSAAPSALPLPQEDRLVDPEPPDDRQPVPRSGPGVDVRQRTRRCRSGSPAWRAWPGSSASADGAPGEPAVAAGGRGGSAGRSRRRSDRGRIASKGAERWPVCCSPDDRCRGTANRCSRWHPPPGTPVTCGAFATGAAGDRSARGEDGFEALSAGRARTSVRDEGARFPGWEPAGRGRAAALLPRPRSSPTSNWCRGREDLDRVLDGGGPDLVVHEMAELAAPLVCTARGLPYVDVSYGPLIPADLLRAAGRAAAPHWRARGLEPASVRRPAAAPLRRHLPARPAEPGD